METIIYINNRNLLTREEKDLLYSIISNALGEKVKGPGFVSLKDKIHMPKDEEVINVVQVAIKNPKQSISEQQ